MVSILTICSVPRFVGFCFFWRYQKNFFYTGSRFSNFNDYISPFVYLGTSIHTKINNKTFFIPNPIKFTVLYFKFLYFYLSIDTTQKMKFSVKDFFSKCDQIRRKLRIWSHLLKKSLMELQFLCSAIYYLFIHGPIIQAGTICNKIPCYLRYSACRWRIVENAKIFSSYVKHF